MKTAMMAMGAAALAMTAGATVRTNEWQGATEANRPSTAYDWGDTANWSLGELPQLGDTVKFPNFTSKCYVKLPAGGVTIRKFVGKTSQNLCLIGDSFTVAGDDQGMDERPGVTPNGVPITIYADFTNGLEVGSLHPYLAYAAFCGRFISPYKEPTYAWGWSYHDLNRYAMSSNPLRTDDFQVEKPTFHPGSGNIEIRAPYGSDAMTCPWAQTEGSPYLQPLTDANKLLAVGTIVTGEGIPEGTFLKRWFENGDIELSQPVTTTSASNDVSFAAFTPEMRSRIRYFARQGNIYVQTRFFKRRKQDIARFEMDIYGTNGGQDNGFGSIDTTFWPGTFVFHTIWHSGVGRTTLRNTHFEFAGTSDGQPTKFPETDVFRFCDETVDLAARAVNFTARMTVTNNLVGEIACFSNLISTVVKDGAGTLIIGLEEATNKGTLTIEEGTLKIVRRDAVASGELFVQKLDLRKGGVLQIPEDGLTFGSITGEDDGIISGPGRVLVNTSPTCRIVTTNGASVVFKAGRPGGRITEKPVGKVAGHPAFWLDANKPSSIVFTEENGTNFVTRWNDCREGEPMFCTNIVYRPQYINGDTMTNRYVRIGWRSSCPSQTYADTEQLVWNVPLKDIRAVFLVHDPTEGGGEILGRSSSRLPDSYYGSQGGPYYRGSSMPWSKALIGGSFYTPCVYNGWFYLNGEQVVGHKKGYLGAFMQLVEHEVNTAYRASSSVQRLACDAFGAGYGEKKGTYINNANGCMRIAEYIIYTNDLTHVERVETSQYLMQKWLGKDVAYTEFDSRIATNETLNATGTSVDVDEGSTLVVTRTTGNGPLIKTGGGLIKTANFRPAGLEVKAGEVIVDGFSLDRSNLPEGYWLNVDASDASSVTYDATTKAVTEWRDPVTGQLLKPFVTVKPTYRATTTLGKPTVDFGVQGNSASASAMRIYKKDGTAYEHHQNAPSYIYDAPILYTTFFVFGSAGGGGSLLGCWGNGYPQQGYPHQDVSATAPMFNVTQYEGMFNWFAAAFTNGQNKAFLNGESINPAAMPFTGNYDLLSVWGGTGRKSDMIGTFGQSAGKLGGFDLGEVLLYSRKLSDDEFAKAQALLAKKWFNRDTEGYLTAETKSIIVADEAKLTMNDGAVTTSALGGGGTIDGDVVVSDGGEVLAVVDDDGAVGALQVNGKVTLPANGRVSFAGEVGKLKAGAWTILSATELDCADVTAWEVPAQVGKLLVSFRKVGNTLVLLVEHKGLILLIR